jgi:hypothetical protein
MNTSPKIGLRDRKRTVDLAIGFTVHKAGREWAVWLCSPCMATVEA